MKWSKTILEINLEKMCGWRDSNPHASRRQILSLVRLPISPHPQYIHYCKDPLYYKGGANIKLFKKKIILF